MSAGKFDRAKIETEMRYYMGSDKYDTDYNDALSALKLTLAVLDACKHDGSLRPGCVVCQGDWSKHHADCPVRACVDAGLGK
jgi:hypothetical protein